MGLTQSFSDDSFLPENMEETERIYDLSSVVNNDCSNLKDNVEFISNIDVIRKCNIKITGFDSNSASASDVYKIKFKTNSNVKPAIMKMFISNDHSLTGVVRSHFGNKDNSIFLVRNNSDANDMLDIIESQVYEMFVYKVKVKFLLDNQICPYFVTYYGSDVDVPIKKINGLFELQDRTIINQNLIRNLYTLKLLQLNATIYNLILDQTPNSVFTNMGSPYVSEIKTINTIFNNVFGNIGGFKILVKSKTDSTPIRRMKIDNRTEYHLWKDGVISTETTNLNANIYVLGIIDNVNYSSVILLNTHANIIYTGTIKNNIIEFRQIDFTKLENIDSYKRNVLKQKVGYILTEEVKLSFTDYLRLLKNTSNEATIISEVKKMILMILIGCASMFYKGLMHNDLHLGNVRVKDLGYENDYVYFVFDKVIELKTRYIPKIYDFDRSYINGFENDELNTPNGIPTRNGMIEKKDFVKHMHNLTTEMFNIFPNNVYTDILTLVVDSIVIGSDLNDKVNKWNNWYNSHDMYLIGINNKIGSNSPSDFDIFNNYKTMIENMCTNLGYYTTNTNARQSLANNIEAYFLDDDLRKEVVEYNKRRWMSIL